MIQAQKTAVVERRMPEAHLVTSLGGFHSVRRFSYLVSVDVLDTDNGGEYSFISRF